MTTATKSSVKDYIHYIITAVIIFGFPFLPNIGSITDEGMVMLGGFYWRYLWMDIYRYALAEHSCDV